MASDELHNETQKLPDSEFDLCDSHAITKGTLDDQQMDEMMQGNAYSETDLLPRFQPDAHINVHYVKVYYCGPQDGNTLTRVSEKPQLMQWRGEHFKCRVGISLDCSMPKNDWTLGLAQACDHIELKNKFDRGGYYSWEFHPLKSGLHKMVNDSNGSQWPFYSHKSSMIDLTAGRRVKSRFYELRYSDYFYPTMHWSVDSGGSTYPLTSVSRRQSFKVWFVAIKRGRDNPKDGYYSRYSQFRPHTDELYAISAMKWRYNIDLTFDTQRPLGSRCVSILDKQHEQPSVLETIDPIPTSALVPPNCNSCQSLIFYPRNKRHSLVLRKEPEEVVVPWNDWRKDMTVGYKRISGFNQPNPLPKKFPPYFNDPNISLHECPIDLSPMPPMSQRDKRTSRASVSH